MTRTLQAIAAAVIASAIGSAASAQSQAELAQQLANPVASLISVPFQFNYDGGFGPEDGDRLLVNVQPVVPIGISEDWNLISRTIAPIVWQNDVVPGTAQFGLGDVVQSLFLSPVRPTAGITWGAGPVFLLRTATDDALGSEKWGIGPTAVALRQSGPWTYGALANHIWSVAGDEERSEVNSTFLQPFLVYTTKGGTSFGLNTETTYDWEGEQASVPVNFQINKVLDVQGQKIQVGAGVRYWIAAPDAGPEGFGARLNFALLFPR
jgi:hypothetical protein